MNIILIGIVAVILFIFANKIGKIEDNQEETLKILKGEQEDDIIL